MKKALLVAISLTAVLLLSACSSSPYKDGSFTGEGSGYKGPIAVTVTIARGKITAVKVDSHTDTPGISDPAVTGIPAAVIKKQSAQVDVISNATLTSRGILAAVDNALSKAKK